MNIPACPICQYFLDEIAVKRGTAQPREFTLLRCPNCSLAFVANPWTEYDKIYSQDYYSGKGADPLLDYQYELEHPESTIRRYEWDGLLRVVRGIVPVTASTTWLDYGCGNGGFLRRLRQTARCICTRFSESWIAAQTRQQGTPLLP